MNFNTTPVPNVVFDTYLRELKLAELKVLLIIIRQTLGWEDKRNKSERKEMDWISNSQLVYKSGTSARSINDAIRILSDKRLIEVISQNGEILDTAGKRKGQQKLYYRLTNAIFATVENKGINGGMECKSPYPNANFAGNLRKNITELTQKMRITKETIQN
ncbi:MAG: replication protein [Bacteroidetes bacterium]|nr:replication protein [Bacteroidota bacterium]